MALIVISGIVLHFSNQTLVGLRMGIKWHGTYGVGPMCISTYCTMTTIPSLHDVPLSVRRHYAL